MVVKVYISGMSGNKEVKKRQQRVILILDSKNVEYELLDIAEPNMEEAKEYMQTNSKLLGGTISDPNPRHPLPPQLFNDDEYCGDYDAFDMANEMDEMEKFLKLSPDEIPTVNAEHGLSNGHVPTEGVEGKDKESSPAKDEESEDKDKVEASKLDSDSGEVPLEEQHKEKSPAPSNDDETAIPEDFKGTTDEQEGDKIENENAKTEGETAEEETKGLEEEPNETEKSEE